jgi:hypothetical protein
MAMTVKNFVINISGVVANKDNSVDSFGAWFDSAQKALLVGNQNAFNALFPSKASIVHQLLALLSPASVSFTDPATSKVISSFTMIITGTVAYADNTVKYFSFEVRDNDGVYKHISDGNTTFDELVADSAANAIIDQLFTDLVGTAVTVTA